MRSRYFDPPRPRLFAHRGSSGHFPENTLPAFRAAVESGLRFLEMDVWASRDGAVVVHHDADLLRCCALARPLTELTLAELQRLDAGYGFPGPHGTTFPFYGQGITIPTLEEVFAACPEAFCNIEIKDERPGVEERVLETIRRAKREETVLLAAEKDGIMRRLRPQCGAIPTSLSLGELTEFFDWLKKGAPAGYQPPGAALQIPETFGPLRLVTAESLAAAHAVGLEVHVWTVNEVADMRRLLELGVDGLMSDYPERLLEAVGSR